MPGNDPPEPERVPVYFADLETFAAYYRLTESVAARTLHRMVLLGYLVPARYWELVNGDLVDCGPAPGWTVEHPMPRPRDEP